MTSATRDTDDHAPLTLDDVVDGNDKDDAPLVVLLVLHDNEVDDEVDDVIDEDDDNKEDDVATAAVVAASLPSATVVAKSW